MKPSTLLLFAVNYLGLASAASIANPDDSLHAMEKRACFKTGANFGNDQNAALNAARTACNGPLNGKYNKRETRVRCYNLSQSKHVMLTVGLTGRNAGSTRTIGSDECYNGLTKEIINCGKGGDTTYGNWRYRADPNEGRC
ncbi:hypothetical protein DL766_004894 [Monosporascus sp. MC13-8B]|uniref:Glycan binding protein Y3-like domain-containing protein n=1 Tax=Monosporascus cannonballus TaxID=155416 RepID=A0ABY0GVC1_9PEZI|nr:hypothetical protein DL762_008998 [Monosporascus cannonballus]RYP00228.1 hypothetical protein DL763_000997 [Monosporascus cannonballus]RYP30416.1 hypothetical protein DL766_004894 [Monosporascus sp. MC13-8B]